MNHHTYHSHSSRSTRKRLITWAVITALAAGTAFMTGLTIQAVDAETMQSEYRRQIHGLEQEITYYKNLPVSSMRL